MVQAATVLSSEGKSRLREQAVVDVVKLTRAAVEAVGKERRPVSGVSRHRQNDTLGPSGGVVAGLIGCGGLGVALPCASAKRSRLIPEVFDDCSHVGRRLSPRDRAIIRELNETVFALSFVETGGIGRSESCEKVRYLILSNDLTSPALHRLHSVIFEFRPPSVTESSEGALRRLLASRTIGSYFMTSDDLAQGSLTVFQSSRAAGPQGCPAKLLTLCHC